MNNEIEISEKTTIHTVPIKIRHENDKIIAGSFQKNTKCISISEKGVFTIELLNRGYTLGVIKQKLKDKYKNTVLINDFIHVLCDANLISSIDNRIVNGTKLYDPHKSYNRMICKLAGFFFSKSMLIIYGLVIMGSALCAVLYPEIVLSTVFFSMSSSDEFLPLVLLLSVLIPLKHEIFHYLAAAKSHVPATFSIGSRFVFIVFKTNVNSLDLVDRKSKIRVYLAGILSDLVTLCLCVVIKVFLTSTTESGMLLVFCIDVIIIYSLCNMLFQAHLLLKTDLYFVFTELFNIRNLYEKSDTYIKSIFKKAFRKERYAAEKNVKIFSLLRVINYSLFIIGILLMVVGIVILFLGSINDMSFSKLLLPKIRYQDILCIGVYSILLILIRIRDTKKKAKISIKDA
jgi:putative peptide zinc metalloprotease protein